MLGCLRNTVLCAVAIVTAPVIARAQVAPVADSASFIHRMLPPQVTAPGYTFAIELYEDSILTPVWRGKAIRKSGAVEAMLDTATRNWVAGLQKGTVRGLQLDDMGSLYVAVGDDAAARTQFETRLATPGLARRDSLFTLIQAVKVFAKTKDTVRMRTALAYMARIDAMPNTTAAGAKFAAHQALAEAYSAMGRGDDVLAHGRLAFDAVPHMPFTDRGGVFVFSDLLVRVGNVLSGRPNGRLVIDSLRTRLSALAKPPAEYAQDPLYQRVSRSYLANFSSQLTQSALLGAEAPVLVATHWFNTTAPTATSNAAPNAKTKSLSDGVIRVLDLGHYSCIWCMKSLPSLDRFRRDMPPGVEVWYVTWTEGNWGLSLKSPDEEAEHLRHYFVERKKYQFPIALWAGPKEQQLDGGLLPKSSPFVDALAVRATPMFVVLDGRGIVRHITSGFAADTRVRVKEAVLYLVREAEQRRATASTGPRDTASGGR